MAQTTVRPRLTEKEAQKALRTDARNIQFQQGRRMFLGSIIRASGEEFLFSGVEVGGKERITYLGRAASFSRAQKRTVWSVLRSLFRRSPP